MRQPIFLTTAALVLLLLAAVPHTAVAQDASLAPLSWLAGCWASESGEAGSGEHWLPLAGGTMLGVGRTVKNGKTVSHEFLQIRSNAEGKLVYIAAPSGQKEATFVVSVLTDGAVIFENLQHDFPQRIIYKALPEGRLATRIEGLRNGALRGIDFPMRRAPCEALSSKPS